MYKNKVFDTYLTKAQRNFHFKTKNNSKICVLLKQTKFKSTNFLIYKNISKSM